MTRKLRLGAWHALAAVLLVVNVPLVEATVPASEPPLLTREAAEAEMARMRSIRRAASTDQELILPYYSLHGGRTGTLVVLNRFSDPIEIELVGFSLSGSRKPLGSFLAEPQSHLSLPLARLLQRDPDLSEGSLHLQYLGDGKMLQAWLLTELGRDVSEIQLLSRGEVSSNEVTSFWDLRFWPLEPVAPVFYLHNGDLSPVSVAITVLHDGDRPEDRAVALEAGQSVVVRPSIARGPSSGWIRIEHDGAPGALQILGRLESATVSAALPVVGPGDLDEHGFETLPIPVTAGGPPWVVAIHNADPTGEPATATLSWIAVESSTVLARTAVAIAPGGLESVSPSAFTPLSPWPSTGRVRLRVDTPNGGLIPWGVEVTPSGSPVEIGFVPSHHAHGEGIYPVPPLRQNEVRTTFVNLSAEPSEVLAQFTSEKGSYALDPIFVAAGATIDLDLRQVARAGRPDLLDRRFDEDFEAGFLQWTSRGGRRLIARTFVTPAGTDDRTSFACIPCCGQMPFGELIPEKATFPSGGTRPFETCVEYSTCTGNLGPFPASSPVLTYTAPFSWNAVNVSASAPAKQTLSFRSTEPGQLEGGICVDRNFTVGDEGPVLATRVRVTEANFLQDRITVSLEPTDAAFSGDFKLTLTNSSNPASTRLLFQGTKAPGSYTFDFGNLSTYTNGHVYNQVAGEWTVEGTPTKGTFPIFLSVLGNYEHTCYNTPLEADYGPPLVRVGTTTGPSTCPWSWTDFYDGYMQAVNLNGSGQDRLGRTMLPEGICGGAPFESPPYCSNVLGEMTCRWWRIPTPIKTSCGNSPIPGTTVARSLSDSKLRCGQSIYVVGMGVRTVQDTGRFVASKMDHYRGPGISACANWPNATTKVFGLAP